MVVPRANAALTVRDVERAAAALRDADVLLLQLELPVDVVAAARRAREGHATVVLNPAPAATGLEQLHGLVDVLVPNQQEAAMLAGRPAGAPPADPVVVGRRCATGSAPTSCSPWARRARSWSTATQTRSR